MKIVTVRRIAQIFFFVLFAWFCVVTTVGDHWRQLRGWPVNLFLQLDPLVALGTLLTTKTVYAGLLWALATVVLTILLGRFLVAQLLVMEPVLLGMRDRAAALHQNEPIRTAAPSSNSRNEVATHPVPTLAQIH